MDEMKAMAKIKLWSVKRFAREKLFHREKGIDGILVTIGLCIIALVLCVVMKDSLKAFVTTLVDDMTKKAQSILSGTI